MNVATLGGDHAATAHLSVDLEAGRTDQAARAGKTAPAVALPPTAAALAGAPASAFTAMPAARGFVPRAEAFTPAARGYATAAKTGPAKATAKATAAKTSRTSRSKATKSTTAAPGTTAFTSAELSFMKDKRLSVEDKLYRFMTLLVRKGDQQLVDAMSSYAGKTVAAPSTAAATKASGTAKAGGSAGSDPLAGAKSLAEQLGGPALAAVATAFGFPQLAPVALQAGGKATAALIDAGAAAVKIAGSLANAKLDDVVAEVLQGSTPSPGKPMPAPVRPAPAGTGGPSGSAGSGSSSPTGSGSGATASTAGASEVDEKLVMLDLQRLVEKQSAMFAALSNVLKATHDGQMTAVQNIR